MKRRLEEEAVSRRWKAKLLALGVALAVSVLAAVLLPKVGGRSSVATLLENLSLLAGASSSDSSTTATQLTITTDPPIGSSIPATTSEESDSLPLGDHVRIAEITSRADGEAGNWTARVNVQVVTPTAPQGLAGALVIATWSGAVLTTHTATTNTSGVAEFALTGLAGESTRFTVLDVIVEAVPYEPTTNAAISVVVSGP